MSVSYSYLYTGTSDILPNTKYKSRLTLNTEQTGDIWSTYYGPMSTIAIHSNDRGFSYIQSSLTKKYLSRNNYGALVWWDNATPNYSDWLISDIGSSAYKTTLLNLKENQHSYLVWNKDDGSTNWWSSNAGNDTWKTYWGLTEHLPQAKYKISCGNCGVIRENRARLYYSKTAQTPVVAIYIIDENGFNKDNPVINYNYFQGGSWNYRAGGYGDDLNYSYTYIRMNYMIKRATSTGTSYSTTFDPSKFYWVRKDGSVSYLDIFNTIDATFVGSDKTRKVVFEPQSIDIPIKNAKQTGTKGLLPLMKTGQSSGSPVSYISSEVTVFEYGNCQIDRFNFSPFNTLEWGITSATPVLSYNLYYPLNGGKKLGSTYYNAYIYFRYSYIADDNSVANKIQVIKQPQNPLYGVISYADTFSYIGKSYFSTEFDIVDGLTYVSYDDPFKMDNIKLVEISTEDGKVDVESYSNITNARQNKQFSINFTVGDDKTTTYPALYTLTLLENLPVLNVPISPFKYSKHSITGTFPHLIGEVNSFVDVALYESETANTNWVKKNDFKVFLNKDNVFKFPLKDVIEPVTIDIPVKQLDSSLHTSDVYPFEYDKQHSLFVSSIKKYDLVLGKQKSDIVINEEPRQTNTFANRTNRTGVYYYGTPLFISGTTSMGPKAQYLAFEINRYNKNKLPAVYPLRTITGQLSNFYGYFTLLLYPTDYLFEKLTTDDELMVTFYDQTTSANQFSTQYTIKDICNVPYLVYYVNSLGGVDVIPVNECSIKSISTSSSTFTKKETTKIEQSNDWLSDYNGSVEIVGELTQPYSISTTTKYTCKTPFLDENELVLHQELFDSMVVFLYNVTTKEFTPVTVSTNSYSIKNKKQNSGKPIQMSFELTVAETDTKTI